MEDSGCSSPSDKAETTFQEQKLESVKSKKYQEEKLIILPQTGLAVRKLPPITSDRDVRLPCKTPTSPLVQVQYYNFVLFNLQSPI